MPHASWNLRKTHSLKRENQCLIDRQVSLTELIQKPREQLF